MKCATLSTLGLAAVLAAGCSDGATAPTGSVASRPRAATVANERTPLAFTLANPCNGEVIPLSGWQHLETHATITRSQSYHFATHMNGYLEGVGARTGTRYVSTFEVHDVHNAKVDGASVYSIGS
jgi:hypothetical protein